MGALCILKCNIQMSCLFSFHLAFASGVEDTKNPGYLSASRARTPRTLAERCCLRGEQNKTEVRVGISTDPNCLRQVEPPSELSFSSQNPFYRLSKTKSVNKRSFALWSKESPANILYIVPNALIGR